MLHKFAKYSCKTLCKTFYFFSKLLAQFFSLFLSNMEKEGRKTVQESQLNYCKNIWAPILEKKCIRKTNNIRIL